VDFVDGNSKKLQKFGLERKISWAFDVFTLPNLEIFNSKNVKNKECVHIWANGIGYISINYCTYLNPNRKIQNNYLVTFNYVSSLAKN